MCPFWYDLIPIACLHPVVELAANSTGNRVWYYPDKVGVKKDNIIYYHVLLTSVTNGVVKIYKCSWISLTNTRAVEGFMTNGSTLVSLFNKNIAN